MNKKDTPLDIEHDMGKGTKCYHCTKHGIKHYYTDEWIEEEGIEDLSTLCSACMNEKREKHYLRSVKKKETKEEARRMQELSDLYTSEKLLKYSASFLFTKEGAESGVIDFIKALIDCGVFSEDQCNEISKKIALTTKYAEIECIAELLKTK